MFLNQRKIQFGCIGNSHALFCASLLNSEFNRSFLHNNIFQKMKSTTNV